MISDPPAGAAEVLWMSRSVGRRFEASRGVVLREMLDGAGHQPLRTVDHLLGRRPNVLHDQGRIGAQTYTSVSVNNRGCTADVVGPAAGTVGGGGPGRS
jgi:hypothetical protein